MKNVILEILLDKVTAIPISDIAGLPQSAREIAEMITAWSEWIGLEYDFHSLAIREIDMKWLYPLDLDDGMEYTIDELFIYWFKEIYKRNQK